MEQQLKFQSKAVPSWNLPRQHDRYVASYHTDLARKWAHLIAMNKYDLARKNYEMGEIESANSPEDF